MPTVVGVKFRYASKMLYFDPAGATPVEGDHVIVSTERGEEYGDVVKASHEVDRSVLVSELKPVLRVANEADQLRARELRDREPQALDTFRRLVKQYRLDMKPIGVELLFDDSKMVFYFAAEERVDFRELVRELASTFKTRIDMRQVGVRDEARLVGGVGHCGQQLCCVRFGGEFQPVSIRMAKEQDLPLNPLKISGLCGRLMCCLRYEYDAYKDFKQRAPKYGSPVETPTGKAKVVGLNTPKELITIRGEDGTQTVVPLAALDCSGGHGCPCVLRAEMLEQPEPVLLIEEPRSIITLDDDKSSEGSRSSSSRKRRKRRPAGNEQQAEAAPAAEAPVAEAPSSSARRRRRRRKPGGGGSPEAAG
jgi:cell fate regulator YaaT (PSP1 superfamily)